MSSMHERLYVVCVLVYVTDHSPVPVRSLLLPTMNNDLTASWLKQNIALYRNSNRVYIDTLAVLEQYPSLRPKTDVYS